MDGGCIEDKVRTHDAFHGRKRKDFAVFEFPEGHEGYGQVLMLFQAKYKSQSYDLALARRFCSLDEEHNTGLEVLSVGLEEDYKGLFVASVEQVQRSIHVVPDFGSNIFQDRFIRKQRCLPSVPN